MTYKNLAVAIGSLLCACSPRGPEIVAQSTFLVGDSAGLYVRGSIVPDEYRVVAELTDTFDRKWRIDVSVCEVSLVPCAAPASRGEPVDVALDALAILARLEMATEPPDDWVAPTPRDYNDITFRLVRDGVSVSNAQSRQWLVPEHIRSVAVDGTVVAEIFLPDVEAAAPGVLLLGGSGGGMSWAKRTAALLANEGMVAMAAAYFGTGDLPPDLIEVPVEYVEQALNMLKAQPQVDSSSLALVGYSKGAELALLVASRRPDVNSVIAYAPGSAVFQGFRAPDYPVLSSWSVGGAGLPFVPNAYDKKFFETFDGMYLWYRTLRQHDAVAAAAIPVENISGDILLISGIEDTIWPATYMGEQIVARLRLNEFSHDVQHLAYPQAGHGIAAPPGQPLSAVAARLGGTVAGNDRARRDGWHAAVAFLKRRHSSQ